jgi:carbamoyltransferase
VLREDAAEWFNVDADSPYMTITAPVAEIHRRPLTGAENALCGFDQLAAARSEISAVTHIDYSARVQTVDRASNPRYHALISKFKERTGCPVIVNTSFNVRGEPIVSTPEDAFRCFMGTEIETLAVGDCFLRKEDQDPSLKRNYKDAFELD